MIVAESPERFFYEVGLFLELIIHGQNKIYKKNATSA